MNNFFVVDIGNSLTKIAYVNSTNKEVIEIKAFGTKKILIRKKEIIKYFNMDLDAKIYISSVAPTALDKLNEIIDNKTRIVIIDNSFFKSIMSKKVCNDEVGVDILASSYYGFKKYKSFLLISCGTVIFASLNFNKKLQGVLIMPSILKSFTEITNRTELINEIDITEIDSNFGKDTKSAINNGYFHMLDGSFKSITNYANEKFNIKNIIICGGNHKNVKNLIFDKKLNLDFSNQHAVVYGLIELVIDSKI